MDDAASLDRDGRFAACLERLEALVRMLGDA